MFKKIREDKSINVRHPDENDKEIVDIFINLGLRMNASKILACLRMKREGCTQFDLMQIFDLEKTKKRKQSKNKRPWQKNQHKVAEGLMELREHGWISEKELGNSSTDAVYKIYSLKKSFDYIIADLEKKAKKDFDDAQEAINRLRKSV